MRVYCCTFDLQLVYLLCVPRVPFCSCFLYLSSCAAITEL